MNKKDKKVFVAMSGGVDSSVAAAILKEQGYEVIGVTMCFSINYPGSKKPSCCGVEGIEDAKRAAQILNIPHYVLDFAQDINKYVIDSFINEYVNGRTPNPCAKCNQFIKFGILFEKIKSLGGDYLATGHYVNNIYNEKDKEFELRKAKDISKDQSYFLYGIKKKILPFLLFPVGNFTKDEVRELARKYKLNISEKPDSQDLCFVPNNNYKEFIENRIGKDAFVPGNFINENGEVVGEHKGIMNYTIGQRDKLGIALGSPVYVNKIDKKSNAVYVGPKQSLFSKGLYAKECNFLNMKISKERIEVNVRIRYNAPEVKGYLEFIKENTIKIEFFEPQLAVSPGQSAVFYREDMVLGGGIIEEEF